ncbi:hypothetical protein [Rossellomorea sp. BNER]|uniref:hypothetical protein n=1 Tax=Rossellomorea sp. BNER TaxID=2962031 RepID=UPI003AF22F57|nr:hypothetical protein [Rossellomorea sp. BNER]
MITLTSLDELKATKEALEKLKKLHPSLFEKLFHVVNLTRALQFKYQYMGCILMDEDPGNNFPIFVQASILRLYKQELQKLKEDPECDALKQTFATFRHTGYEKISLLVLGETPESLVGASYIK